MLLALDLGNTNITIGVFEGEELLLESRVATDPKKMRDQYAVELSDILSLYHVDPHGFDGAIVCSVVPSIESAICKAVQLVTGIRPVLVGPGIKTGINIRIDNPAQLGTDLLVGAVAAVEQYGAPCIVWDLGTATTISVVNEKHEFLGVVIMAGVRTALDALVDRASLLPRIRLETPPHVVGTNTVHSMQSGVLYSTAAMMDGMTERVEQEIGRPCTVVATGGLSRTIVPHCRRDIRYDEHLILTGLRILYERNRA